MRLPQLSDFSFQDRKVLVRSDFDVPLRQAQGKLMVEDDSRILECLPTVEYLLEHNAKEIILMGHLGRPEGKVVGELSLKPVAEKLKELLNSKFKIQNSKFKCKIENFEAYLIDEKIILLENIRFDSREEGNDLGFAKELASLGDFYVNEAFAVSHREHASIVGIPKFLPHCAGLHFVREAESLSKVLENPKRPVVFVIGGAKPETKLPLIADFARIADTVLVGGTLCQMPNVKCQMSNVKCARLTKDGFDIDEESIKRFSEIIQRAGTVVWNGPMGKYEEPGESKGTRKVGEAIANSNALKIVGGGDTIAALNKFGLVDKMDWVSTGGGAMLEFLAKGILPGMKALL
ncbi:MAG: phosphoglycerate kinase [Microgenomates group bacterium]